MNDLLGTVGEYWPFHISPFTGFYTVLGQMLALYHSPHRADPFYSKPGWFEISFHYYLYRHCCGDMEVFMIFLLKTDEGKKYIIELSWLCDPDIIGFWFRTCYFGFIR